MAIQVSGTQVIGNSRELTNIASVDATTAASITAAGVGSGSSVAALTPAATVDISLASADYFTLTLDQNTTLTVSDVDAGVDTFNLALTGYTITVVGYGIAVASYDNVSFSVTSQETSPHEIAFSSDGTKMYIVGLGSKTVYQYTLSTGWDLSTASYDSVSFSVASQDIYPYGMAFSSDGTKMYIAGIQNDRVYQYTLGTAWDLSTTSYDSVSFSVSSQTGYPYTSAFSGDGTKMYIINGSADTILQYTLSTGWDLSTASYDSVTFDPSSQDTQPYGLAFSSDGTRMVVVGATNDSVYQYTLSTAWNVGTASYDSVSFSVASQDGNPFGIAFSSDGTKMFMVGYNSDSVYQYDTNDSVYATVTYPASFNFPAGTPPAVPLGGVLNILEAQTTDGGTSWNVTELGAAFA